MKKRISFTSVLKQKEPSPCMGNSNKGGLADLVQDYQDNPYQQYNLRFDAPLVKSRNSVLSKQSKTEERTFDDWIVQQARQNKENYFQNQTKKAIPKQLLKYSKKVQKQSPMQTLNNKQKMGSKTNTKKNIKMSTLCQMFMENQISDQTEPVWRCKNLQSTESLREKLRQSLPSNFSKQFVEENNFSQRQAQKLRHQFTKVRDKKVEQIITNQSLDKKRKIGPLMIQLKKSITQEVQSIAKKILSQRVYEEQIKQQDQNLLNDCPQQDHSSRRVAEINHQIQEYLKLKGKRASENQHPTFNNFNKSLKKTQYDQSMEAQEERVGYSFGHNLPHESQQVHYSNQKIEKNVQQSMQQQTYLKKSIDIPQSHIAKVQSLDFDSLTTGKKTNQNYLLQSKQQKLSAIEQQSEGMLKSSHGNRQNKYPPRPYQKISFNKVMSKKSKEQQYKCEQSIKKLNAQSPQPQITKKPSLMSPELQKFKKNESYNYQNKELQQPLLTEQKPNKLENSIRIVRPQYFNQSLHLEENIFNQNVENESTQQTAYTINLEEKQQQKNEKMQFKQSLSYNQDDKYPYVQQTSKYENKNNYEQDKIQNSLKKEQLIYLNTCEPLKQEASSKSISIPVLQRQINLNIKQSYKQTHKAIEKQIALERYEEYIGHNDIQQDFQCEKPSIEKNKSQIFEIQRIIIQNKDQGKENAVYKNIQRKTQLTEKEQSKQVNGQEQQDSKLPKQVSQVNQNYIITVQKSNDKPLIQPQVETITQNQFNKMNQQTQKEQSKLHDSISMRFSINLDSSVRVKQMPKPSYLQAPSRQNLRESIQKQPKMETSIKQQTKKAQLDDFQFDLELD